MKTKKHFSYMILAGILLSAFFFLNNTTNPFDSHEQNFRNNYNIYAFDLPENMTFAGEPVPLYDPDIRERLDRELLVNTYWHSQTLMFFKRANKWFPIIEPILEEYNIPEDFKYLPIIESGLMQVVSPAGAVGFWQIMEHTGKEYGLTINDDVDERYNVELSTRVAAEYLLKAYQTFGNWTLAAASYNMGIAGVRRAQERQQVQPYYDLALNMETSRFVFRVLAVKEIMENPDRYGFNFEDRHLYPPLELNYVEVNEPVESWVDFAHAHGLTYKSLRVHNPWIRNNELRNREKNVFKVALPATPLRDTVSMRSPVMPDTIEQVIEDREQELKEAASDPEETEKIFHIVGETESLSSIARMYDVRESQILQWNDVKTGELEPGSEIKIIKE